MPQHKLLRQSSCQSYIVLTVLPSRQHSTVKCSHIFRYNTAGQLLEKPSVIIQ
jgi:hypothetical protein